MLNCVYRGLKKGLYFAIILLILSFIFLHSSYLAYGESDKTCLFITPAMYIAEKVGEFFNVSINIKCVKNLYSFQFCVTFNNSILDVVNVVPGQFFPQPVSRFTFIKEFGHVRVDMSLVNAEVQISGDGTLAWISFKVIQGSESCLESPIDLTETLLLDSNLLPIMHDYVGAVYFWESVKYDPPLEGRLIDLYTQRGGQGLGKPGGVFALGETVFLIAHVTYNYIPVQYKLVSFEVLNPLNESIVLRTAVTDEDGFAIINFKIPSISESVGTWKAISVVSIAEKIVWDIISFEVYPKLPVGGRTFTVDSKGERQAVPYFILVMVLAASLTLTKRKVNKLKP